RRRATGSPARPLTATRPDRWSGLAPARSGLPRCCSDPRPRHWRAPPPTRLQVPARSVRRLLIVNSSSWRLAQSCRTLARSGESWWLRGSTTVVGGTFLSLTARLRAEASSAQLGYGQAAHWGHARVLRRS